MGRAARLKAQKRDSNVIKIGDRKISTESNIMSHDDVIKFFAYVEKTDNMDNSLCFLGRYLVNLLYAKKTGNQDYVDEKFAYFKMGLAEFLKNNPIEGVTMTEAFMEENCIGHA